MLESFRKWINSIKTELEGLALVATDFIERVMNAMMAIGRQFERANGWKNVFIAIGNVFHFVVDAITPLVQGFKSVFDSLDFTSLTAITRHFRAFTEQLWISRAGAEGLSAVGKTLGGILKVVGDAAKAILSVLGPVVIKLQRLVDVILAVYGAAYKVLAPIVSMAYELGKLAIIDIVTRSFKAFISVLGTAVKKAGKILLISFVGALLAIVKIITKVISLVRSLITTIRGMFAPTRSASGGLREFIDNIKELGIIGTIVNGLQKFASILDRVAGTIIRILGFGFAVALITIASLIGKLVYAFNTLYPVISKVFQDGIQIAITKLNDFKQAILRFLAPVTDVFQKIKTYLTSVDGSVIATIVDKIKSLREIPLEKYPELFKNFGKSVLASAVDIGSAAKEYAKNFVTNIVDSIKNFSGLEKVADAFDSIRNAIFSPKVTRAGKKKSVLEQVKDFAGAGLVKAVSVLKTVGSKVEEFVEKLKGIDALSPIISKLQNAVRVLKLVGTTITAFSIGAGAVVINTLTTAFNALASIKFDDIKAGIDIARTSILNFIKTVKQIPIVNVILTVFQKLYNAFNLLVNRLAPIFNGVNEIIDSFLGKFTKSSDLIAIQGKSVATAVDGVTRAIDPNEAVKKASTFQTIAQIIGSALGKILGFFHTYLPGLNAQKALTVLFVAAVTKNFFSLAKGIGKASEELTVSFKELGNVAKSLNTFVNSWTTLPNNISAITENIKTITGNLAANGAVIIKQRSSLDKAIKNMAISVAILAGALYMICQIPPEDLERGKLVIGQITAIVLGFSMLIGILSKIGGFDPNMLGFAADILAISFSMILIVGALKALESVAINFDDKNFQQRIIVLIGAVLLTGLIPAALTQFPLGEANASLGTALTIIAMAGAVYLIVEALKRMSTTLNDETVWANLQKGIPKLVGMILAMAAFAAIVSRVKFSSVIGLLIFLTAWEFVEDKILKIGTTSKISLDTLKKNWEKYAGIAAILLGFSVAVGFAGKYAIRAAIAFMIVAANLEKIVVFVQKLGRVFNQLSLEAIAGALVTLAMLMGTFMAVFAVIALGGKHALKAAIAFIAITEMTLHIVNKLKQITEELTAAQLGSLEGLLITFGIVISMIIGITALTKDAKTGAIFAVSLLLGELVMCIMLLSILPYDDLLKSAGGLALVLASLGYTLKYASKMTKDTKTMAIVALVGAVAMIVAALAAMMYYQPDMKAIAVMAASIALPLYALSSALKSASKIAGENANLGVIFFMIAGLAAIIGMFYVLSRDAIKVDIPGILAFAVSVSLIMYAFGKALKSISGLTENVKILPILMMIGVMASIAGALYLFDKYAEKVDYLGLISVAASMSLVLLAIGKSLSYITGLTGEIKIGPIFAMIPVVLALGALFTAIAAVFDKFGIKADPKSLLTIAASMSLVLVAVGMALHFVPEGYIAPDGILAMIGPLLAAGVLFGVLAALKIDSGDPKTLLTIAASIGIVLLAVGAALAFIPPEVVEEADILAMIGPIIASGVIFGVLAKIGAKGNPATLISTAVSIGLVLMALGKAISFLPKKKVNTDAVDNMLGPLIIIGILFGVLAHIGTQASPTTLIATAVAMGAVLLAFTKSISLLPKKKVNTDGILEMSIALVAIGAALWMVARFDWASILAAAVAVSGTLFALVLAMNIGKGIKANEVAGILVGSLAIIAIGGGLSLLAKYDWASILASAVAVSGTLLTLAFACQLANGGLMGAVSLLVGVGAIVALGWSLSQIAQYDWQSILAAGGAMAASLVALALACDIAIPGIVGAVALLIGVPAILAFGWALANIAQNDPESIKMTALAMAASLIALGVACDIAIPGLLGSVALLVASPAILAMGWALSSIAQNDPEAIKMAGLCLAGALIAVGVACLIATPAIAGAAGISAVLISLGIAFAAFGFAAFGFAAAVDSVSNALTKLVNVLAGVVSAIGNGIVTIVTLIYNGGNKLISTIKGIFDTIKTFANEGIEGVIKSMVGGMDKGEVSVGKAAAAIGKSALNHLVPAPIRMSAEALGRFFTGGFAEGITDSEDASNTAVRTIGDGALTTLADTIDAHSNSWLTTLLGMFFGGGFGEGIGNTGDLVNGAADMLGLGALGELEGCEDKAALIGKLVGAAFGENMGEEAQKWIDKINDLAGGLGVGVQLPAVSALGTYMKEQQVKADQRKKIAEHNAKMQEKYQKKLTDDAAGVAAGGGGGGGSSASEKKSTDIMDYAKKLVENYAKTYEKFFKIVENVEPLEHAKEAIKDLAFSMYETLEGPIEQSEEGIAAALEKFKEYQASTKKSYKDILTSTSKVEKSYAFKPKEMLENMRENRKALDEYDMYLELLAKRNLNRQDLYALQTAGFTPENYAKARAFMAMTEKEYKEYNDYVVNADEEATNRMLNSYTKITAALEDLSKHADEETKKVYESTQRAVDKVYILSTQMQMKFDEMKDNVKSTLIEFGDSFEKFEIDESKKITAEDFLSNLESRERAAQEWTENLTKAMANGASSTVIEKLRKMGVEASYVYAEALAEGDPETVAKISKSVENLTSTAAGGMADMAATEIAAAYSTLDLDENLVKEAFDGMKTLIESGKLAPELAEAAKVVAVAYGGSLIDSCKEYFQNDPEFGKNYTQLVNEAMANSLTSKYFTMDMRLPEEVEDGAIYATTISKSMKGFANRYQAEWAQFGEQATARDSDTMKALQEIAETYAARMIAGLDEGQPKTIEQMETLTNQIMLAADNGLTYEGFKSVMDYAMQGLIEGVWTNRDQILDAIRDLSDDVIYEMEDAFEEESPSKITTRIGKYLDMGLAGGITDNASAVLDSTGLIAENTIAAFSETMSLLQQVLDSNMDLAPVITPVLDISNIQQGFTRMGALLSDDFKIGIGSRDANAIAAAHGTTQNAPNVDSQGNTYNFTQNNYSPKALSRLEIYRQTRNQFARMKGMVEA